MHFVTGSSFRTGIGFLFYVKLDPIITDGVNDGFEAVTVQGSVDEWKQRLRRSVEIEF